MNRQLPLVLLCDTNIQRLKQNQQLISRYFQTEIATDQTEALVLLRNKPFDIAVIDKTIGNPVLEICRNTYPQVVIIPINEQGTWSQEEADHLYSQIRIPYEDISEYPLNPQEWQEMMQYLLDRYNHNHQFQGAVAYQEITQVQMEMAAAQPQPIENRQPHLRPPSYSGYPETVQNVPGPYNVQVEEKAPPIPNCQNNQVQMHQQPPMNLQQQSAYNPAKQPMGYGNTNYMSMSHSSAQKGVYAFYAPKGGVGKTTISVNMGLTLAKENMNVCLLDLDVFYGNAASLLRLNQQKPFRSITDWVDSPPELDQASVCNLLMKHPSGLWILPSPRRAIEEDYISAEVVGKVFRHVRTYFDIILIDLGPSFKDPTVLSFQYADKVFLISDLDRTTLGDCKGIAEELRIMNVPLGKVEILFNNISGSEGITVKDATQLLSEHYQVSGTFPSDPKVKLATNKHDVPVVLSMPKAPFSKAITEATSRLFEVNYQEPETKKRGLLSFFSKKKEGGFSL